MASVSQRLLRRARPVREILSEDTTEESAALALASRRRLRARRTAWIVGGLLALVLLAPWIVAQTPLCQKLVNSALSDLRGHVEIGGCSLNWFAAPRATDVNLRDADGRLVAALPKIQLQRTLLALLFAPDDVGPVQIERPTLKLVLAADGRTNVEEVFARYLDQPSDDSSSAGLDLHIEDAQIEIVDELAETESQLQKVDVHCVLPGDGRGPLQVALAGQIPAGRGEHGSFDLQLELPPAASGDNEQRAVFELQTKKLPLAQLRPLLARFAPDLLLGGTAESDLAGEVTWNEKAVLSGSLSGLVSGTRIALKDPALGPQPVQLAALRLPCEIRVRDGDIEIQKLQAECDFGQVQLTGGIPQAVRLLQAQSLAAASDALLHSPWEISAQLDLAQLAQTAPHALHVREDVSIESGDVTLQMTSQETDGVWKWQGLLQTSRLAAAHQGKTVVWEQPLDVDLAVQESEQGLQIERIHCTSSFIEAEASGTRAYLEAHATYNLDKLAAELGRFIDLAGWRLRGDGWAYLTWQTGRNDAFAADADLEITQFELSRPGVNPWTERKLAIHAAARGRAAVGAANGLQIQEVSQADVQVVSATDELLVKLLREVAVEPQASWPLDVRLRGGAARWLARFSPWIGRLDGWEIDGQTDVQAQVAVTADQVRIDRSTTILREFHAWTDGLWLTEPSLQLDARGAWSRVSSSCDLQEAKLASATLEAQARDVHLALAGPRGSEASGQATFTADLGRLLNWLHDPALPATYQAAGLWTGDAQVQQSDRTIQADFTTELQDVAFQTPGGQPWREERVTFVARGGYDRQRDLLTVEEFNLASRTANLAAQGEIAAVSTRREATLEGRVDYDWEQLLALLRPYIGDDIQIAGREQMPFTFRGPLAADPRRPDEDLLARWEAQAQTGWHSANVYGIPVPSGQLQGLLQRGQIDFSPLELALSGGQFALTPHVRLSPEPQELTVDPGTVLSRVNITPEMCNHWLQYVAPVMAGVTQARGTFSVALDNCRLPLADLTQGDLGGRLQVHDVEIGPGPLVQELAVLLGRSAPARLVQESQVTFRMVDGRIYHRDLVLVFPDLTIKTYGYVGLDRSLSLMAEMPIPPKWLGNNPVSDALRNEVIRVPIAGTLDRPQLDRRLLDQMARDFLQRAAGGLLRGELNRQLDRLLPRLPGMQQPQ